MDLYVIVLRILHILAGVFWVSSTLLLSFFIQPTAKALGPQGGPFMGHLMQRRNLPNVIAVAGLLTIVAGLLLYWESSGGLDRDWIESGPGIGFTAGAVAAIVALALGLVLIRPAAERMGALQGALQASGGPPSEVQATELQRLDRRLHLVGNANVVLLIFAVAAMAVARYL